MEARLPVEKEAYYVQERSQGRVGLKVARRYVAAHGVRGSGSGRRVLFCVAMGGGGGLVGLGLCQKGICVSIGSLSVLWTNVLLGVGVGVLVAVLSLVSLGRGGGVRRHSRGSGVGRAAAGQGVALRKKAARWQSIEVDSTPYIAIILDLLLLFLLLLGGYRGFQSG